MAKNYVEDDWKGVQKGPTEPRRKIGGRKRLTQQNLFLFALLSRVFWEYQSTKLSSQIYTISAFSVNFPLPLEYREEKNKNKTEAILTMTDIFEMLYVISKGTMHDENGLEGEAELQEGRNSNEQDVGPAAIPQKHYGERQGEGNREYLVICSNCSLLGIQNLN